MATTSDTDALFRLPLAEFTAARNALAARLKKAGNDEEAERVKALAKPSISAWTVNQLYWRHRKPFDAVIASGERFRKAQAAQLAGKAADLRGPLDARREALSELTTLAARVLREQGSNPAPDIMRRVTTTLEALATYGSHPDAPRAGRLSDDIDPPGFEVLAALVPQVGRSRRPAGDPPRVIPFQHKTREARTSRKKVSPEDEARQREEQRKAEVAAAKGAVAESERALRHARKEAAQAEAALKTAAARAKEAEHAKRAVEQEFEKLNAAFESARQAARKIASDAEEAAQAVEDAERALDKAKGELEKLT